MSEPWRLTAHEAQAKLRARELTSVELTNSVLERLRQVEPRVKAFITITEELAREQIRLIDADITKSRRLVLKRWRSRRFGRRVNEKLALLLRSQL